MITTTTASNTTVITITIIIIIIIIVVTVIYYCYDDDCFLSINAIQLVGHDMTSLKILLTGWLGRRWHSTDTI